MEAGKQGGKDKDVDEGKGVKEVRDGEEIASRVRGNCETI